MEGSYKVYFRIGKYFFAKEETIMDNTYFLGRNNEDYSYSQLFRIIRRKPPEPKCSNGTAEGRAERR